MKKPLVIKLGGILLDNIIAIDRLFSMIHKYQKMYDRSLLIVHGGGYLIDEIMKKFNYPIKKKNGLRITPNNQINLVSGALSVANKILLSWAKRKKINAIGLCLSDGNCITVNQTNKDLGNVGIPKSNSADFYNTLFKSNLLPIISSIGITDDGLLMNVNADLAATEIAITLKSDLILLSDVSAILDGKGQRITNITTERAKELINQGVITNGMVIKVLAALDASRSLGHSVDIASWQNTKNLELLFNGISTGTRVLA